MCILGVRFKYKCQGCKKRRKNNLLPLLFNKLSSLDQLSCQNTPEIGKF